MAIKRYFATGDTSITDAYKPNLSTRATGSNMGLADSLEVFTIYGQASTTSREKERILVKFPANAIKEDFDAGEFPDTAKFYLRLFNVKHTEEHRQSDRNRNLPGLRRLHKGRQELHRLVCALGSRSNDALY